MQTYYYEITHGPQFEREGGLLVAPNYEDAKNQLIKFYEPDLIIYILEPIYIKIMNFPLSTARQIKTIIDINETK